MSIVITPHKYTLNQQWSLHHKHYHVNITSHRFHRIVPTTGHVRGRERIYTEDTTQRLTHQNRWPHIDTTASLAVSKHMLHSKLPLASPELAWWSLLEALSPVPVAMFLTREITSTEVRGQKNGGYSKGQCKLYKYSNLLSFTSFSYLS